MVIEVEKELVSVLKEARKKDDGLLVRCCEYCGVGEDVRNTAFAPDVNGDTEEARTQEMDRMVNDSSCSIENARLLRLYLAVKGHLWSQYLEGYNFHFGRNVKRDYAIARYWYEQAAERGESWAQNNLGVLYSNGLGVETDDKKAVYWYTKSAEGGDIVAKGNLAEHLMDGLGVRRSYRRAAKLLKEYLESTPFSAKHHRLLAECYEHGIGGRKWRSLAVFHYQEASDFGSGKARKALRRLSKK